MSLTDASGSYYPLPLCLLLASRFSAARLQQQFRLEKEADQAGKDFSYSSSTTVATAAQDNQG